MKLRGLSFKTKLILSIEAILLLINGVVGFVIWNELSTMVREMSRNKLKTIAATTAAMIDVKAHEKIQDEEDTESKDYEKVRSALQKIMKANPQADDIYTARKLEDGRWIYILGGYETTDLNMDGIIGTEEEEIVVGEEFDASEFPEIENALSMPTADQNPYCDKWGCWLSGYAPIRDNNGNVVAVAGIDFKATDVMAFEKKTKLTIFSIITALIVLFPLYIYFFLLVLLKPVSVIIQGLNNFRSDLSSRINIVSKDEFGLIAHTFNNMASELEELYFNLEGKVQQQTKELRQKVDEIQQKKAKDEALLESIGEGIIATNKSGEIIIINKQTENILGLREKDMLGKKINKIIKLEDEKAKRVSENRCPISQSLSSGKKITSSAFYLVKDGRRMPITITSSPVMLGKKVIGAIEVFRDITKEKEIDRAKSEFVSLASHQLGAPLASINWYAEMLLEEETGRLSQTQRKYLEKIYKANQKMAQLVDSLLSVSRIEMGTFVIEPENIGFKELTTSVIEELKPKILEKKIKLSQKYDKDISSINADPKLLKIIFQNLLSNAIKYTPEKGKVSIAIEDDKRNEGFMIKISDTGYGIPEDQKDKIFTKLFRADNVKGKETEGSGLGLYLVKSIIDQSGGKIWFDSVENKGTTFYIFFPQGGMKKKRGPKPLR